MSGIVVDYPLDFSRPELRSIRDIFARAIYQPRESDRVVLDAGLNRGLIEFSGMTVMQWGSILVQARAQERLPEQLSEVRKMQPPLGARIDELLEVQPVLESGMGQPDELSDPKGDGWKGFGAERLVVSGVDTLLGIA